MADLLEIANKIRARLRSMRHDTKMARQALEEMKRLAPDDPRIPEFEEEVCFMEELSRGGP